MKILKVRFQNLNALYGKWSIDFTHPHYTSAGIFAIIGPTGAGKSTILDAICLALYGATPRLGKITKNSNEIMSRKTAQCYAEVIFEAQNKHYRCFWSQRRSRKKAMGNLMEAKHEISDALSGEIIESKKSKTLATIEQITGLDFDRFMRSILLAQGRFDSFLKAGAEQKSKILEQITGTEIYSEISRQALEKKRNEQQKLAILKAQSQALHILDEEQEQKIQQELDHKQKEEIKFVKELKTTQTAIAWLKNIDGLKAEINHLSQEATELQAKIEAFQPEQEKLNQAEKAAALDGIYASFMEVRKQQSADQKALHAEEEVFPQLEASAGQQKKALENAQQQAINAKEKLKIALPLIQQIRLLDQKLVQQHKIILKEENSCQSDKAIIDANQKAKLNQQHKQQKIQKTLKKVEKYLNNHHQDEWLISNLAAIETQMHHLQMLQQKIAQKQSDSKQIVEDLEQTSAKLDEYTKQSGLHRQKHMQVTKDLLQAKDALNDLLKDRLLREYRAEKNALLREMALLTEIKKLEDYREKLEDGKACPLCGSEEHPFAKGNIPKLDENEKRITILTTIINKAEDQINIIETLKDKKAIIHKNLSDSEKQEAIAASDTKAAQTKLTEFINDLKKSQLNLAELKQEILDALKPLDVLEISEALQDELKIRKVTWQNQSQKKIELEKQITDMDSEIKRLDAIIKMQNNDLNEKITQLDSFNKEYAKERKQRQTLYGNKDPEDEEKRLNEAAADAEEAEKNIRNQHMKQQQQLSATMVRMNALQLRIDKRTAELQEMQGDFAAALTTKGFLNEQRFAAARLSVEQREALNVKAKRLNNAQIELKSKQQEYYRRLTEEQAKQITSQPLDELEPQYDTLTKNQQQIKDAIAALRHQLSENIVAKARMQEGQVAIQKQQQEYDRWDALNQLIGSFDGKKYRNFAQGLTFEIMIAHANWQLQKMTDRYLLIQDDQQPLELNVIDDYQAGEIRSINTLSGGESFIVSLALALGLSKMASKNVQMDSLFLDEGFGSLDEEALENALEMLSSLQQEGKLIGVISHVAALKERIYTQIIVKPISQGKSIIVAPGCCSEN